MTAGSPVGEAAVRSRRYGAMVRRRTPSGRLYRTYAAGSDHHTAYSPRFEVEEFGMIAVGRPPCRLAQAAAAAAGSGAAAGSRLISPRGSRRVSL